MPNNISNTKSVIKSITKSIAFEKSTVNYDFTITATKKNSRPFQTRAKMANYKKLLVK